MNAAYDDVEQEVETQPVALVTATMKAELDHEVTTARAYPRSVKRFINDCMDLATLSEEVAESCIYALPRGGKMIEGPSARFAEIIQSSWGNCRAGARVIDEGAEFVTAEGVFYDLESNSKTTMQVKRRITDKNNQRFNTDMIAVTGNAAASIAHRNAVLKGIPKALWDPIYKAAHKTVVGDIKSLANKRAEALAWLQKQHVSEEMVLATLGIEGIEDIGLEQLGILRGAIAAVKNGEATLEQAFAPRETTAPRSKPKTEAPKAKAGRPKKDAAAKDQTNGNDQPGVQTSAVPKLTIDQITALKDQAHEEGVNLEPFLANHGAFDLSELPASSYQLARDWISAGGAQ
jgi:hypothetical protein